MKKGNSILKDNLKFDQAPEPAPVVAEELPVPAAEDLSLHHLQLEMARIDSLIALSVERWQRAGRDPNDAFRGLVVTDEEAGHLLMLPFATHWGDLAAQQTPGDDALVQQVDSHVTRQVEHLVQQAAQLGKPLRLQRLIEAFQLNYLEINALLLTLAPALDLRYEQLYGYLQNDINRKRPTVSLLTSMLCSPGTARLAALVHFGQDAPLLRYALLEAVVEPGGTQPSVLAQGLTVDRTVVAWLLGSYQPRAELAPFIRFQADGASAEDRLMAQSMAELLAHVATLEQPLLLFHGPDAAAQRAAARTLAEQTGAPLLTLDMAGLNASGIGAAFGLHLALRDARMVGAVMLLDEWDVCLQDQQAPAHLLVELYNHPGPIVVASRQVWQPEGMEGTRMVVPVAFELPDYAQRKALWQYYVAQAAPQLAPPVISQAAQQGQSVDFDVDPDVDPVEMAGQFTLSSSQIRDAVSAAVDHARRRRASLSQADLYGGARLHSGVRLGDSARKITARYTWDDIILPFDQIEILRELVATVRGRSKVLEEWGLGRKLASSAAVAVLFAGPPGTGKTMAAEVLANDLGLDLYKIDLSNLVSKYIGETEKNLERIFNTAQSSNAILFFDEADAIFGKRSGVKDARDRYANIEVSYLLQRMEYYDGVTILATNLRSNIDEAFLRRLQFAIDIPFPDEKDRLRIWETLFPADVPRADNVQLDEMAKRFKLAGGNIRNIILGAAYLAASDGGVISMQHLLHSTRREFQKMGRLVPEEQR